MNSTAAMINQAIAESAAPTAKSVCVKNLPRDCPELKHAIYNVFEPYGLIRDIYVPTDRYTGLPIGFGFIEFIDQADAIKAVASLHRGIYLAGKRVRVALAEGGRKQPTEMAERQPAVALTERLYAATMERICA